MSRSRKPQNTCEPTLEVLEDRRMLSQLIEGTQMPDYFQIVQDASSGFVKVKIWENMTAPSGTPTRKVSVNMSDVLISGLGGNDTFELQEIDSRAKITFNIHGGEGYDKLWANTTHSNVWTLVRTSAEGAQVFDNKLTAHAFTPMEMKFHSFDRIEELVAGNAGDTFKFLPSSVNGLQPTTGIQKIDGRGSATVDYSSWSRRVYVNLNDYYADGVGWVVTNIKGVTGGLAGDTLTGDNNTNVLKGGPGDDFLDGRGGDDYLYGEGGHDVLLGGWGNDSLDGSTGFDILIGGTGADDLRGGADGDYVVHSATLYDSEFVANPDFYVWWAFSSVWKNTTLSVQQRVERLAAGVSVYGTTYFLLPYTVAPDYAADRFAGGPEAKDDYWVMSPIYYGWSPYTGKLDWVLEDTSYTPI